MPASRILLLGVGTVGGAVLRLLPKQNIEVAAVMSHNARHSLELQAPAYLQQLGKNQIFHSWAELQAAPELPLDAVIELTGGDCRPIYRHFLQRGIPIITANKGLLAEHGAELFPLARKHQTVIACEASCGGGIPLLQNLLYGLRANHIHEFHGVLNGTCNFILAQMERGDSYGEALRQAQAYGLAEAEPFLDISGTDSAHKLAILAMMSFGYSLKDIPTSGVDTLSPAQLQAGNKLGLSLKLLASARQSGPRAIALRVGPCYIPQQSGPQLGLELRASPLAYLVGSFNGISFYGNQVGHIYLEGRGAGASATASAVLADLYQVLNGSYRAAFRDFPNWPRPEKILSQNQWHRWPQNWLGFAPLATNVKNPLFELDGYRIFLEPQLCAEQLPDKGSGRSYIPILQLPQEQLRGELRK